MTLTDHRTSTSQPRVERADQDLVRLYLNDIGRYPMLTKDDEVRLAQAIENGVAAEERLAGDDQLPPDEQRELRRVVRAGQAARTTFVQSNLRLVVSIAKRYQGSGQPLLDLIQEGNLGLMHAVEKFDWRPGFKFSTYATWWIRQAITRGVTNTGRMIRLPARAASRLSQVQRARWRLEFQLHRPATVAEIAAEVEMPDDKVAEVLRFSVEPRSLSEPLREGSDNELGDFIEDQRQPRTVRLRHARAVHAAMSRPCSARSTSGSGGSSPCASASIAASRERSKRSASTSTSPTSGSVRSRLARCRSCAVARPRDKSGACSTRKPAAAVRSRSRQREDAVAARCTGRPPCRSSSSGTTRRSAPPGSFRRGRGSPRSTTQSRSSARSGSCASWCRRPRRNCWSCGTTPRGARRCGEPLGVRHVHDRPRLAVPTLGQDVAANRRPISRRNPRPGSSRCSGTTRRSASQRERRSGSGSGRPTTPCRPSARPRPGRRVSVCPAATRRCRPRCSR